MNIDDKAASESRCSNIPESEKNKAVSKIEPKKASFDGQTFTDYETNSFTPTSNNDDIAICAAGDTIHTNSNDTNKVTYDVDQFSVISSSSSSPIKQDRAIEISTLTLLGSLAT